jgi:uncharacterized damage-inducible protein DinB
VTTLPEGGKTYFSGDDLMDAMMVEVVELLEATHRKIEMALDGLPDEALDWSPGPDLNTLGVLLAHTFGAERFWIGDVAGREPSGRARAAEFETRGRSAESYIEQSRAVLAHSRSILGRLKPEALAEERTGPPSDRVVTAAWAVLHALEHTALHAGHIEITRQLWSQRNG